MLSSAFTQVYERKKAEKGVKKRFKSKKQKDKEKREGSRDQLTSTMKVFGELIEFLLPKKGKEAQL
jgi:F0F1-type ATP synthase assembly protein I